MTTETTDSNLETAADEALRALAFLLGSPSSEKAQERAWQAYDKLAVAMRELRKQEVEGS